MIQIFDPFQTYCFLDVLFAVASLNLKVPVFRQRGAR